MLTAPTFPITQRDGSSLDIEDHDAHHHLDINHLAAPSVEDERGRRNRSPVDRERSISPVLERGPSGVEVVKLGGSARNSLAGSVRSGRERAR